MLPTAAAADIATPLDRLWFLLMPDIVEPSPCPWEIGGSGVRVRYYMDPITEMPHIYKHGVVEAEVDDILRLPGEDRPGSEGSRVAVGQTRDGRYLRVIYVPDPEPNSVFVITAYELKGKPLQAYRRRMRRRRFR